MGQLIFKGGSGSIQFKGGTGTLSFLSYNPMPDPTVTVQWIYEAGQYKAKATIKNNYEYDARLKYTVTLGETVDSLVVTLPGLEEFTPTFYNLSKSPDNGFLFKVEAFIEDEDYVRPNSNTITKQTTANFRRYLYNEGQDIAGMRDGVSTGEFTFTKNSDHIYVQSRALYGVFEAYITIFPDSQNNHDISLSTDKKLFIDWSFISGDNDRDFIEIKYKTSTLNYISSFGRRENSFNIVDAGHFYDIDIKLSDYTSPGGYPSANIYKLYIETINNGPLVQ